MVMVYWIVREGKATHIDAADIAAFREQHDETEWTEWLLAEAVDEESAVRVASLYDAGLTPHIEDDNGITIGRVGLGEPKKGDVWEFSNGGKITLK